MRDALCQCCAIQDSCDRQGQDLTSTRKLRGPPNPRTDVAATAEYIV
jgi:hypothetical protein